MTNVEPSRRAAALVPRTNSPGRRACSAAAGDHPAKYDGADHIVKTLRNYLAPETADSISGEVARFLQVRRTDKTIGG